VKFFERIRQQAQEAGLLSDEHFSVDGTLIEAWASISSFRPKDGDPSGGMGSGENFRGERRRNDTHESKTDPDARMYRKGEGKKSAAVISGSAVDGRTTRLSVRSCVIQRPSSS